MVVGTILTLASSFLKGENNGTDSQSTTEENDSTTELSGDIVNSTLYMSVGATESIYFPSNTTEESTPIIIQKEVLAVSIIGALLLLVFVPVLIYLHVKRCKRNTNSISNSPDDNVYDEINYAGTCKKNSQQITNKTYGCQFLPPLPPRQSECSKFSQPTHQSSPRNSTVDRGDGRIVNDLKSCQYDYAQNQNLASSKSNKPLESYRRLKDNDVVGVTYNHLQHV